MNGWRYWWRRYLGWLPFQPCYVCGKWYWGGLPRPGWRAVHQDYCSRACCEEEYALIDEMVGGDR